jgi:hypothetical protein
MFLFNKKQKYIEALCILVRIHLNGDNEKASLRLKNFIRKMASFPWYLYTGYTRDSYLDMFGSEIISGRKTDSKISEKCELEHIVHQIASNLIQKMYDDEYERLMNQNRITRIKTGLGANGTGGNINIDMNLIARNTRQETIQIIVSDIRMIFTVHENIQTANDMDDLVEALIRQIKGEPIKLFKKSI